MNFQIIISGIASLTHLVVQMHATYSPEQVECARTAFVTFFGYLNGVLESNGKPTFEYSNTLDSTDWETLGTWSKTILDNFNKALKKISSSTRSSYQQNVETQCGLLQNSLITCSVGIYDSPTKTSLDKVAETLGSKPVKEKSKESSSSRKVHVGDNA